MTVLIKPQGTELHGVFLTWKIVKFSIQITPSLLHFLLDIWILNPILDFLKQTHPKLSASQYVFHIFILFFLQLRNKEHHMKVLPLICFEWSHNKVSSKEHIKEYHIKALLNRFRLNCHTLKSHPQI